MQRLPPMIPRQSGVYTQIKVPSSVHRWAHDPVYLMSIAQHNSSSKSLFAERSLALNKNVASQGDLRRAERFLKLALDEAKQGFGPDDPHVAAAAQNLAELYRISSQHDLAGPLYEEVSNHHSSLHGALHNHACLVKVQPTLLKRPQHFVHSAQYGMTIGAHVSAGCKGLAQHIW